MILNLLLAHPTGNTFFRAAARAFHSAGWLRELHSCICWDQTSHFSQRLPQSLVDQLQRRSFDDVPIHLQHSHPWREVGRLASASLPLGWRRGHVQGPFSVDGVYRSFDRHVAARLPQLNGLEAVYAYEDGALRTFQAARALGLRRIYDLPIGYWRAARQIFEEEAQHKPEWACTLTGLNDSPAKLARKDQEIQLAELVIVPSEFVRSTLVEHHAPAAPITVVPFGSPAPRPDLPVRPNSGPLRVLYVGSLGQRKGLSYALDAVESLGAQVSLTLIGRIAAAECIPLMAAVTRHRWIETLPYPQILEQMRQHDVLVLPSLFEGYALVISEALSQGLPVMITPNTGGTVAVRDGIEGFIVPIRDSESIAERLQQLSENPDQLAAMRQACFRRAAELSWSSYEQNLRLAVGGLLELKTDSK